MNTSHDRNLTDSGERTFAAPRSLFYGLIACVIIFPFVTVSFIWAPLANRDGSFPEESRIWMAVTGGCTFGVMWVFAIFSLFAMRGMRVVVSRDAIRVVDGFSDRSVPLADVTRARWRVWGSPRGSLLLHTRALRSFIGFGNYARGHELAAILRQVIPTGVQENYESYSKRFPPVRVVKVFSETETLRLAMLSLLLAIAFWACWDLRWVRALGALPVLLCPAVCLVAILDSSRRPSRRIFIACAVAMAAVAVTCVTIWPELAKLIPYWQWRSGN